MKVLAIGTPLDEKDFGRAFPDGSVELTKLKRTEVLVVKDETLRKHDIIALEFHPRLCVLQPSLTEIIAGMDEKMGRKGRYLVYEYHALLTGDVPDGSNCAGIFNHEPQYLRDAISALLAADPL